MTACLLAAAACGAAGCQSPGHPYLVAGERTGLSNRHLVLESSAVTPLREASRDESPDLMPWWATRNHVHLSHRPGADEAPYDEATVVYTTDRLQTYGDRIYDVHRRTRYSTQWR